MKATLASDKDQKKNGSGNANLSLTLSLIVALALVIGGSTLLFTQFFGAKTSVAQAPTSVTTGDLLAAGTGTNKGSSDDTIAKDQARIAANDTDYSAYSELGLAFQQKARETNDPTYYTQAEDALKRALALKSDDYNAVAGMGTLNLSKHEFSTALDWGNKAIALIPAESYAYGVIGDAQIELGLYDGAVQAFQKMVDLRPDLSSYSRVSYARELYGDIPGAIQAMQSAINAGSGAAENTAWCRFQLGTIYMSVGQLDNAEKAFTDSLAGYPDYLHAYAGLGQLRWAQGKTAEAIDYMKKSVAVVPLPQYLMVLGDMYQVSGDTADAKVQYDLVLYIYKVFEAAGLNVSIEKAMFMADHDMDIPTALSLAQTAGATRNDVNTQDSLAWVLYKAGKYDDAQAAETKAMRLGTQNALFFYHMGMIQKALGNQTDSQANFKKAISINPYFSILHSAEAASLAGK